MDSIRWLFAGSVDAGSLYSGSVKLEDALASSRSWERLASTGEERSAVEAGIGIPGIRPLVHVGSANEVRRIISCPYLEMSKERGESSLVGSLRVDV